MKALQHLLFHHLMGSIKLYSIQYTHRNRRTLLGWFHNFVYCVYVGNLSIQRWRHNIMYIVTTGRQYLFKNIDGTHLMHTQ